MFKHLITIIILFFFSLNTKAAGVSINGFADIVEPLMPAVVNIYTVHNQTNRSSAANPLSRYFSYLESFRDPYWKFFEEFEIPLGMEDMYSNPKAMSLGSGVIIAPEGYIVTNHHVIENAAEVMVKLSDNTELAAKIIGSDPKTDLALLKVNSKNSLPFVKFGDSSKARVGDWIIAIGNPFGLGGTVTAGIISSKMRDIQTEESGIIDNYIQTDAAINSGNSGGPMFNIAGEIIGINTAIYSISGGNTGIGFAIPSSTVSKVIEQLKTTGKVKRGYLGIRFTDITSEMAEAANLEQNYGIIVTEIDKGSAADKAGIRPGDVIIKIDDKEIKNGRKLQIAIAEVQIDTDITLTIIRDGKAQNIKCHLTALQETKYKSQKSGQQTIREGDIYKIYGITFANISNNGWINNTTGLPTSGVIVENIAQTSPWRKLSVGDLILSVNQVAVDSVDDIAKVIDKAQEDKKSNIMIMLKRGNHSIIIALPLQK